MLVTACLVLVSCGGAQGKYTAKSVEIAGFPIEFNAETVVLELKSGDKASLTINNDRIASVLNLEKGKLAEFTWEEVKEGDDSYVVLKTNEGKDFLAFEVDSDDNELELEFGIIKLTLGKK